jgi:ABC-type transporter Mla maintaining outer membrane lipid asymmetry ATPase subunit MlaF
VTAPILSLSNIVKDYRGLRPLRIERLEVGPGDQIAISGIDQPAAEVLVNLVTGAILPERGSIHVFGRATSAIADSAEWLSIADRFGIVSERAVLLEGLTALQNLAMPFSLQVEPPSEAVRSRAEALGVEVGLSVAELAVLVGALGGSARLRVRLGRAIALDPAVLLFEHPTAGLDQADVPGFARAVSAIAGGRGMTALVLTADEALLESSSFRVLELHPATGRLRERRRRWFRRP